MMLVLEDVSLEKNGKYILKNINAKFDRVKIYAVLGSNGVGKSSLAYTIMGLEGYKPTSGKIKLNGEDITNSSISERATKGITLLWQEPVRFQGLTVKQYLTLGGKLKISTKDLEEVMTLTGLSPELYINRFVDNLLSGGERKRVELASILLLNPKYAILDEPDSGIDIMSLGMIEKIAHRITKNGGTIILITHREEIARIADEAYLLCNGTVFTKGDPVKVIHYYKSRCDECMHVNIPSIEEAQL